MATDRQLTTALLPSLETAGCDTKSGSSVRAWEAPPETGKLAGAQTNRFLPRLPMHSLFTRSWYDTRRVTCRGGQTQKSRVGRLPTRLWSGGGESRTPVRLLIPRNFYVRSSLFFSPRPISGQRTACHEPVVEVSPVASRHRAQASSNLLAPNGPPRTGLIIEREVRNLKRLYLRSQSEVIVRRY
jgi:hypothetical protein